MKAEIRKLRAILVTGGAGFIGTNFIQYLFRKTDFKGCVVNLDKLTYAANPKNLADIESEFGNSRYFFEHADICDTDAVKKVFQDHDIDTVVHLAAESHVDRSIIAPDAFITTNVLGTFSLLEVARTHWRDRHDVLFHHVSTDEVYGSLGASGTFIETSPYTPRNPYSASKASSDHLVRAYYHTYGLPATISNCSNNYGPYQFPEKLIPLMIMNMLQNQPLPLYGDGRNIRDWLYVEDHANALWTILNSGGSGKSYNVGGENECENIKLVNWLCEIVAELTGKSPGRLKGLVRYVKDRPGHDRRYAINCEKLKNELAWTRSVDFQTGLKLTVRWYLEHQDWVESVRSGEYIRWIECNYHNR